jgi:3-hydroxyisobutyrate dehydrogenase
VSSSGAETTVGVIGLGAIGAGVAGAVARSPFRLVVCDVRPEATAPFADAAKVAVDPAEVGSLADVVVVCVVDDDQVRSVLAPPGGALGNMRKGGTVLVLSTVSVATVIDLAATAGERGVAVVDCGVTGGPSAAADGELVSMVGGTLTAVDRIRPVLDTFSTLVVHMGELGTGLQAKLARNLVQYGAWAAAYEGQLLAEAAGIELSKLAQVIRASEKRIGGTSTLMFRDTVRPFPPGTEPGLVEAMRTAAGLAHKDLGAAMELARSLGVQLPLAELTDALADAVFGMDPGDDESDGEDR